MATNPTVTYADQINQGNWTFGGDVLVPAGTWKNADVSATAAIDYTKLNQLQVINREIYAENSTVLALASQYLHAVRGTSGTNVAFQGWIGSVAGATDNVVNVDLQATVSGSSAFATVLSNLIIFRSTGNNTIYTPVSATFATSGTDMTVGDTFRLVVTVAGSTATQPKGLAVSWYFSEAPS